LPEASTSLRPIPPPNAEAALRKYVDEAWPDLTDIGFSQGASRDRLSFTTDMKKALSQADLVQEKRTGDARTLR